MVFLKRLKQTKKSNSIVVFNNQWTPIVQLIGLILIIFKIKFIWCVRGSLEINNLKKFFVWHLCQKYIINRSQYVLVSSRIGKEKALDMLGAKESFVIQIPNILETPNQIKPSKLKRNKNGNKAESPSSVKLLYFGRIHSKKKIHTILENLDINKLSCCVDLTIAGYAHDAHYIKFISEIAEKER